MQVKLTEIFKEETIIFDKKINFVFGKNGTGKSTLTKEIKDKYKNDYDIRVFEGFEGIVDSQNRHLNAILLGRENVEINKKISEIKIEIEQLKDEITKMNECELKTAKDIYTEKLENLDKLEKEIQNFERKAASEIKNLKSPQLSKPNYDYRDFHSEIVYAKRLDTEERNKLSKILKSDIKIAKKKIIKKLDLNELIASVEKVLMQKIEEKKGVIIRLENDKNKKKFAELGLQLHKPGDTCAFCGNVVKEESILELTNYFDATEITDLHNKIKELINEITEIEKNLDGNALKVEEFYVENQEEVEKIKKEYSLLIIKYKEILLELKEKLNKKNENIFESIDINIQKPITTIERILKKYNDIVEKNNNTELEEIQENARNQLRYDKIYEKINDFDLKEKNAKVDYLMEDTESRKKECNKIYEEIANVEEKINIKENKILELKKQTVSEEILVKKINERLKPYVNFELAYCKSEEGNGYYKIKDTFNKKMRSVFQLSKGEQNIIAFLYFLGELEDITLKNEKEKIVIFDDPMSSNDDVMQYVIMTELENLMSKIKDENMKLIIMTHNKHFYINATYSLKEKRYKKNNFYKFYKVDGKTEIIKINRREEDFVTSYEGLWRDLKYLFEQNVREEIMLNPIRRIIETFIKFNNIPSKSFYGENRAAKKLFDVNSHSIDDLEADLNGNTKEEILTLMKECFIQQGFEDHFNNYWNNF